jgi:transposase InsO family protein
VQIDATRFSLRSGPAWVYLVLDVLTRSCIGLLGGSRLSKHAAAQVLMEATATLRGLGIEEPLVIQSDAGSDFTSAHFQELCASLGSWVRCRVNEAGGMGIVERLHKTFKYEFVFREEVSSLPDLLRVAPEFVRWYNVERLHSSIGYDTPWQRLTGVEIPT